MRQKKGRFRKTIPSGELEENFPSKEILKRNASQSQLCASAITNLNNKYTKQVEQKIEKNKKSENKETKHKILQIQIQILSFVSIMLYKM